MIRILYCDDIGAQRRGFENRIARQLELEFDVGCETAGSYLGFRAKLEAGESYDIVITDMNFEKAEGGSPRDGLEILRDSKEAWPECEVLLLTAFLDDITSEDLRAIFLELKVKPDRVFSKVESEDPWQELLAALRIICRIVGQKQELEFLRTRATSRSADEILQITPESLAQVIEEFRHFGMIGRSYPMRKLFAEIDRYSPYDKNVLITGETGVGKGMVARAMHHHSRRAQKPYSEHNSSTIHENIAESELFGFAPDSGVSNAPPEGKRGLLVATDGGTLFLDEIGDMPLSIQAKMLKVVDRADGTFFPVGAEKPTRVDVHFVLATHKNLEVEVERGNFRRDFLFRIRGVEIQVPPLRERKEDIPLLVADQILRFCKQYDRKPPMFSREAMILLTEHSWTGNVRELQDTVDCVLMAQDHGAAGAGAAVEISAAEILRVLQPVDSRDGGRSAASGGAVGTTEESDRRGEHAPGEEAGHSPREEARRIIEQIMDGTEKRTLSQIKRFHGEPVVKEVMRFALVHLGRYPNDDQASRLFDGMTANAWRQFAFSHGITLRKLNQDQGL